MARLQLSGSRADLALTGTCWHQVTASLCNQEFGLVTVWQHLALADICKQLLRSLNGTDHGIAALSVSMALQYHAMRVELFMVLVITHEPRRFGQL